MLPIAQRTAFGNGLLLGSFDVQLKGETLDCSLPARFFFNYQKCTSVWAEVLPARVHWLAATEVKLASPGHIQPVAAALGGLSGTQKGGTLTFSADVVPLRDPIESVPSKNLKEVTFALLDSPVTGKLVPEQRPKIVSFPCGQFEVKLTEPTEAHREIAEALGSYPHRLTNSGTITARSGQPFNSKAAGIALDAVHNALSFAAGRWVGITLVEATDASGAVSWFRWGTTIMSDALEQHSWYDPRHPEWITPLCDAMLQAKSNEETWEVARTALYWYVRSNTKSAGIDSSLILSQCALELLSWFVIVKLTGALSEEGYGQIGSASEKLRLALSLLGIPRQIPRGLTGLAALSKECKDVAEAIVQARNYLVHPTQPRTGKKRTKREYPWYELWIAAQWVLELVILRLLGYSGSYHDRTQLRAFNPVERVPWA